MREADLRLHLQLQGVGSIRSVHYPEYGLSQAQQDRRFDALSASPGPFTDAVLFDVAQPSALVHVGRYIVRQAHKCPVLTVGPSSVVQSLPAYWRRSEERRVGRERVSKCKCQMAPKY